MGCRHENRFRKRGTCPDWIAVQVYKPNETRHLTAEILRCMDCDAMLGMEPARDDERTEIEVRAAELATDRGEPFGPDRFDYCPENKSDDLCPLCQSFHLAHFINEDVSNG